MASAKLARSPALIPAGPGVVPRPISASVLAVLARGEGWNGLSVLNGAPNGVSQPTQREFRTSAISRDIDTAAKFTGAGATAAGVAGSDAGTEQSWQPCHWLCQKPWAEAAAVLIYPPGICLV